MTLVCTFNLLRGQAINAIEIFSNTHGIRQEGTTFYEVEGYTIFVQSHRASFDDKGFKKIKKKYSINKEISPVIDTAFQKARVFVKTQVRTKKITESGIIYLFPQGPSEIIVIGLQTTLGRDEALEKFFVKSILENSIPNSVYTTMEVDGIRIAGRFIELGPGCYWMSTHNVQCPNLGQMNWSEFRNIDKAKEMVDAQSDITAGKSIGQLLEQDSIKVIFEGKETQALRMKYKLKVPQVIMGGSNILIIYYVVAEVRGKYVACVLSHYDDEIVRNTLPPLLKEIMSLRE
ncbi:MAG: hypothetical protein KDC49_20940 [Saprospiraceae bacterium]|nr:hypothetical protein [Saprospiraceae bacterium]